MTEKKEHDRPDEHSGHNARNERDGEYTDVDPEDVSGPEPESGEYTDSDIPGDK